MDVTMDILEVKHEVDKMMVSGFSARFDFTNGYTAYFHGYAHGFGYGLEGLQAFILDAPGRRVFVWNGRLYRTGPQEDEHKIVTLADGYTQEAVAEYWESARNYAHNEYWHNGKKCHFAWCVTSEGWIDLDILKEGRGEYLAK